MAHTPLRRDRSGAAACKSVLEPLARVAHHGCLRATQSIKEAKREITTDELKATIQKTIGNGPVIF